MKVGVLLLFLIVVVGGIIFFTQSKPSTTLEITASPAATPASINAETTSESPEPTKTITLAEVAEHSDKENCWLAIEGKVYDVTPFIAGGMHPGKLMILMGCGKDATSLFNARPNSGTAHSSRAREMLPKYYVGDLAE